MIDDLVIDESNFKEYFFDVREHPPKPDQVMACFEAIAEFVDGNLKRDIIQLLMYNDSGAEKSANLIHKIGGAKWEDAVRIVREMAEDLSSGMRPIEVTEKPYEYRYHQFFYTEKQYVPDNDPHWWSTSLVDMRLTDASGTEVTMSETLERLRKSAEENLEEEEDTEEIDNS